jgi:hypothetical protein
LLRCCPGPGFERVVDQLIREHHASLTSLARFHHETPPGTAGRTVLGEVLGEYAEDQRVPMSDFSRMVADLLVGAGLPEPLLEHQFWDDDGLIQMVDLAYPGVLAIGLDSLAHHRDRATFIGDRRARNRLELLGVKVLLFTWWDYTDHPERLVAQVRSLHSPAPPPPDGSSQNLTPLLGTWVAQLEATTSPGPRALSPEP